MILSAKHLLESRERRKLDYRFWTDNDNLLYYNEGEKDFFCVC